MENPHTDLNDNDDWLAVKASIFLEPETSCKLRPNFHVSWNCKLYRFCLTFNEHSRVKSDTTQRCSYAKTFSIDQVAHLYKNLALLCPPGKENLDLTDPEQMVQEFYKCYSADLPKTSWSEFFLRMVLNEPTDQIHDNEKSTFRQNIYSMARPNCDSQIMDKLCQQIEAFLAHMYRKCSHFTFMSTLFEESFGCDEYFENLNELRHKTYIDRIEKARGNFETLQEKIYNPINTVKKREKQSMASPESPKPPEKICKTQFFHELDQSVEEICDLLAEYYTYMKEPFLDLREIARNQIDHWMTIIDDPNMGEKVKEAAREKSLQRREEVRNCSENLRDLQQQYYAQTKEILAKYHQALKKAVVKSPNAYKNVLIMSKIVNVEKRLAFANLNYAACKLGPAKLERKAIFQQMSKLDLKNTNVDSVMSSLEKQLYQAQHRHLEAQISYLQQKDNYLKCQLKEMRLNANISAENGQKDEEGDVFFETTDNERDLKLFLDRNCVEKPKITMLKSQMEQANQKLAVLRTKKKKLDTKMREGHCALLASLVQEQFVPDELKIAIDNHTNTKVHSIHEKLKQDRRITLQRIKSYRKKNAGKGLDASIIIDVKNDKSIEIVEFHEKIDNSMKVIVNPVCSKVPMPPPPPPPMFLLEKVTTLQSILPNPVPKKNPAVKASANVPDMDSVFNAIKSGEIRLKKVTKTLKNEEKQKTAKMDLNSQLLAEMMNKIRKMAHCSEDEEEDDVLAPEENSDFED